MIELIVANWFTFLVAFLIGVATAWWVWARYALQADTAPVQVSTDSDIVVPKAKVEPIAVAAAVTPIALMDTVKTKAKAVAKPKAAAKPKAESAKVKTTPAPKVAAVAKAKVAAPKVKAAPLPKPAAAPKPKADPVPKAKAPPTPKVAPKPKPKAAPKPIIPDNLELLKGVGPKLNALLKSMGVTSFQQVANWTPADVREIDAKLGNFAGRISRDNWIDQAKLLLSGNIAAFEKKYGSLGSEIKNG
jgi:predicted flap endonuclease-1-like 5' DNA nuclease